MNFKSIISTIFGSKFSRDMKEIQPWVEKCKAAQEALKDLSNDELRERTLKLREQIQGSVSEQEAKIAELEAERAKGERKSAIAASMEKHKIPAFLRDRLAMSISDEEDIDAAVTAIKQEMITNGLPDEGKEGPKAASEKQIDEAADSLLESITVK